MSKKIKNIYRKNDSKQKRRYMGERTEEKFEHDNSIYLFSYAANEWIEAYSSQWKPSSLVKYSSIINKHLLPEYGQKNIYEISRNDISLYTSRLISKGGKNHKGLAPKTVNSIISVMKNIFEYAGENMGYSLISFKGLNVKQGYKPIRTLTMTEQSILSEYLAENKNFVNLGILMCLFTGLRVGEICALKWEDVSFEDKCIYVRKTMQRLQTLDSSEKKTKVVISAPKSDCSKRVIPIPCGLLNIMREFKDSPNTYVLTGTSNCYIEPRTLQNQFKSVIKKCNIKNANFHALRHTFATRCIELGFDIKSLSEILGHASVSITLNIYVHPSMEIKQKNMNMLSDLLAVK